MYRSYGESYHPYNSLGEMGGILEIIKKIPIVGRIAALFEKDALTADQQAALARLPEPYLSLAIGELQASGKPGDVFDTVYRKYVNLWQNDQKVASEKRNRLILTVAGIGAATLGILGLVIAIRPRKKV